MFTLVTSVAEMHHESLVCLSQAEAQGDEFGLIGLVPQLISCINEKGEVAFMKAEDRLCLINTKIIMLREGRIIFYGTDEELFEIEVSYIRNVLLEE